MRLHHVLAFAFGIAGCEADGLQIPQAPQAPDMGKIAQCGAPGEVTRGRLAKLLVEECGALLPQELPCEGQPPQPCTNCAASGNEGAPL